MITSTQMDSIHLNSKCFYDNLQGLISDMRQSLHHEHPCRLSTDGSYQPEIVHQQKYHLVLFLKKNNSRTTMFFVSNSFMSQNLYRRLFIFI